VPGGKDIPVTQSNLSEYLEACLRYRTWVEVQDELKEILLGVFDVIPERLLTILDAQDLDFLLCGLPTISVEDWKAHTMYSGECNEEHLSCRWFWEVVSEYDREKKDRLFHFVTGTYSVPEGGFGFLERTFTIRSVPVIFFPYPRVHVHTNRIDLPVYETKEELQKKLKMAG
jgi:hypothetical protein